MAAVSELIHTLFTFSRLTAAVTSTTVSIEVMWKITNTGSAPHSCLALQWCVSFLTFPSCPSIANALANASCERCKSGFAATEKIVNSNGELYHEQCFVCAQCFQQFPEGLFYEVGHFYNRQEKWFFHSSKPRSLFFLQFEGRKYCEHDFQMLFAPCCHQCGEYYLFISIFLFPHCSFITSYQAYFVIFA